MNKLSGGLIVGLLSITLVGCSWFDKASKTPLQFSSTPPTTVMVGQEYRYDITVTPEVERDYTITVSGQPDWLELQTEASLAVSLGKITGNISYLAADGGDIYFYGDSLSEESDEVLTGIYKFSIDNPDEWQTVYELSPGDTLGGLFINQKTLYFAVRRGTSTSLLKIGLTNSLPGNTSLIRDIPETISSIVVYGGSLYWTKGDNSFNNITLSSPTFISKTLYTKGVIFSTFGIDAYNELQLAATGLPADKAVAQSDNIHVIPYFLRAGAYYDVDGSGCITGIVGTANLGTYFASTNCVVDGENKVGNLRFVPVDWPSSTVGKENKQLYEPGDVIYGPTNAITVTSSGRIVWASEAEQRLKTFSIQQNTLVGTPTEAGTYNITLTLPNGVTQSYTLTVTEPPVSYNVTGTVYGLQGTLQLSNNGTDILRILTSDEGSSSFSFTKQVQQGEAFDVTVLTDPVGQTCSVRDESAATGTMGNADVELIVDCEYISYNINGSVEGLNGELELLLSSEQGEEQLLISEDGGFSFTGEFIQGDEYSLTIQTQPVGQMCELTVSFVDENGDAATPMVTGPVDLPITCTTDDTPRTLSVTVSGLPEAATIDMGAVGPEDGRWEFEEKAFANGTAAFTNTLLDTEAFSIAILMPPLDYICNITGESPLYDLVDGEGIVDGNVSISVSCAQDPATIPRTLSVTVTGLPDGSSVTMSATGPVDGRWAQESKAFSSGTASFENTMFDGETFDINKTLDPDGYSCSITGESPLFGLADGLGTVDGNVTITVSCVAIVVSPPRTLSVTVIGLPADGTTVAMRAFGPDDGRWLQENKAFANGTASFTNTMLDGETFDIRIIATPTGYSCSITDEVPLDGGTDGFGEVNGDVTVTLTCVNN